MERSVFLASKAKVDFIAFSLRVYAKKKSQDQPGLAFGDDELEEGTAGLGLHFLAGGEWDARGVTALGGDDLVGRPLED